MSQYSVRNFNNAAYTALASDLLEASFYLEGQPKRTKLAVIRSYTEIIVRRILDIPNNSPVTLGKKEILIKLRQKSNNNSLLLDSIENIRLLGNKCTHTQDIEVISDDDINSAVDSLFNIYAYILIDYFERYEFGSNSSILFSFSILPPIIRYIVLNYLHENYPQNMLVIDKLTLAILKAFDEETAIEWIDTMKDDLMHSHSVSEKAYSDLIEKCGEGIAKTLYDEAPNMYELCVDRIKTVANAIDKNGLLCHDFESAIEFYQSSGNVDGTTLDVVEFNDIMEFLYLGRKKLKQ